jgi:hypothetical protein
MKRCSLPAIILLLFLAVLILLPRSRDETEVPGASEGEKESTRPPAVLSTLTQLPDTSFPRYSAGNLHSRFTRVQAPPDPYKVPGPPGKAALPVGTPKHVVLATWGQPDKIRRLELKVIAAPDEIEIPPEAPRVEEWQYEGMTRPSVYPFAYFGQEEVLMADVMDQLIKWREEQGLEPDPPEETRVRIIDLDVTYREMSPEVKAKLEEMRARRDAVMDEAQRKAQPRP